MPKPMRVHIAILILHLESSLSPLDRIEKLLAHPGEHANGIQLHTSQCKFLVCKLFKIREFFMNTRFFDFWEVDLMSGNLVNAMKQMHCVLKRSEDLVGVCCYKDASWLNIGADIKEEIIDILLELQTWVGMVVVGVAQTRGIIGEQVSELELLREVEEEYENLLESFRESNSELEEAALEDKKNLLEKLQKVRELCLGHDLFHTNDCLLAVYMLFRLESGNLHQDDFDVIEVLKKYEINKPIGSGSFGTVLEVTWLNSPCVLKIDDSGTAEGTCLHNLHHPNIIQVFYHWEAQVEDDRSHTRSFMLMELMSMDLARLIVAEKTKKKSTTILTTSEELTLTMPFQLNVAVDIMLQVAKAMDHLHDNKVIHRDLKPSNILVNPCNYGVQVTSFSSRLWDVKIADFGLCKGHDNSNSSQTLRRGTPRYAAPEMFCREGLTSTIKIDPKAADVWSFGMTSSEILFGEVPFENESGDDLHAKILRDPTLRPALPSTCPQYLRFVLSSCWKQDPQERPSFRNILKMLRYARLISLGMIQLENCCSVFSYTTKSGCNIRMSTHDGVPPRPSARPPKKIPLSQRLIANILTSQGCMGGGNLKKLNNQKVSSIPQLVENLKSVLVEEWKLAVQEIRWLAENPDNHPHLVAAGVIPLLLSSLATNALEVQEDALQSLNALLAMKEIVNINLQKTLHYLVKVLKYGNEASLECAVNIISKIMDSQSSADLDFYALLDKSGVIATFKELSIYGSPLQQWLANIALPWFPSFEDLDNLYTMQMLSRWNLGDFRSDSNDMDRDDYSRHAAINVGSTYPIVQAMRNVRDRGEVVSDFLQQVFAEPCMMECFGCDWKHLAPPSNLDFNGMPLDDFFTIFRSYVHA